MITIHVRHPELGTSRSIIESFPCRIGRHADNGLVLPGWRVARVHAEIEREALGYRIKDCGSLGGTWVNGERLQGLHRLQASDEIVICGYHLRIEWAIETNSSSDLTRRPSLGSSLGSSRCNSNLTSNGTPNGTSENTEERATLARSSGESPPVHNGQRLRVQTQRALHRRLVNAIDLRRKDIGQLPDPQLRVELAGVLRELLSSDEDALSEPERELLIGETLDEAIGLGPLEHLISDPEVTEIMVNGAEDIFVERRGRLSRIDAAFTSDSAVRAIIERIVAPLGRRIDESSPMVDARLVGGSRVNAVLPPLALHGPVITIRKFSRRVLSSEDLLELGSLNAAMLAFLRVCIQTRRNIAISGGTGSGKTSLLNVLAGMIPSGERIITIEDAAELRLPHDNQVALEARQANSEGRGAVEIRDLVRNALRMRPDRIVVGECRSGETLDMLQAMNTGHDGSMTTLHANSARDVSSRLETMALMAGIEIPVIALREQIANGINIIVHQARLADGSRKIVDISEVTGIESARVQMQCLFRYAQHGSDGLFDVAQVNASSAGRFSATGLIPQFYEPLMAQGHRYDLSLFNTERH